MLTTPEVTRMRAIQESALPGTATIRRLTRVSDGGGGYTEQWTDIATVACRLAPVGGGEGVTGGRVDDRTTHIITLPALTDVTEADRLLTGGQTFEATLVRTRGQWELSRRVEAREVR